MSTWTHVVGCVRVDGLPQMGARKQAVAAVFGPMCLFDAWDDSSTIPRGSEGGLQYEIIEYSTGLPWLAVPIWGDLRDYSDADAIVAWAKTTIENIGSNRAALVRDASIMIYVEGGKRVALSFDGSTFTITDLLAAPIPNGAGPDAIT